LHADYTVPMEELCKELRRICEATPLWKGEVCVLQASDATEPTVQLRALMDARNSSDAWTSAVWSAKSSWNIFRKIIRRACRASGENCKVFRTRRINCPNQGNIALQDAATIVTRS
jgi:hypothetical protein